VRIQGGSPEQILKPEKLPSSPQKIHWKAQKRGYIAQMNTETIGKILVELGGGRKKTSDTIDPGVGMVFHRKLGSFVQAGDPILTVHAPARMDVKNLEAQFHESIEITNARKPVPKLVFEYF
jgi:pyrimidine-nucleoside phosphorylase